MGISIHYSGKFNRNATLSELIIELKEIAEAFNWKYHIYETVFPENPTDELSNDGCLYGIDFTPPESETVSICFLSNYKMSCSLNLMLYGDTDKSNDHLYMYTVSTKTQFAGPELHKTVIEIFRHLQNCGYFEEFSMSDESDYWETRDEQEVNQKFAFIGSSIESFGLALNTTPKSEDETYEKYFERLTKMIQKRSPGNQN